MTAAALYDPTSSEPQRQLFMVLSPRSLSYAQDALESLFRNSIECLNLHLITDSTSDRAKLEEMLAVLQPDPRHRCSVTAEDELNDVEAKLFATFPHLRAFRHGHPCWRKVTDPLLLSERGAEMILLDPDLYFPNLFRFEETAPTGLKLMWQKPNCLLPPEIVRAAMDAGIRLARHVDIGVSHWRAGSDLEWIDWMIGKLSATTLPRMMHVEAIVWAAIAMREGGGYLNPREWVCWHRTQTKRVQGKLGATGERILAAEPWDRMRCFHAGGEAKWWVPEFMAKHPVQAGEPRLEDGAPMPFVELTRARYEQEQRAKGLLQTLGYYRVFGAKAK